MPKTKTKRGRAADRRRIARGQPYEVNYFARKHGLTAAEAREISRLAAVETRQPNWPRKKALKAQYQYKEAQRMRSRQGFFCCLSRQFG